jgi:hypothetical protein
MSTEPTNPTSSAAGAGAAGNVPQTAGAPASGSASGTANDRFSSLADFKAKYPKFWKEWELSIAQTVCADAKRHSDHLVQLIREGERHS